MYAISFTATWDEAQQSQIYQSHTDQRAASHGWRSGTNSDADDLCGHRVLQPGDAIPSSNTAGQQRTPRYSHARIISSLLYTAL
jgi:hypothetical protein